MFTMIIKNNGMGMKTRGGPSFLVAVGMLYSSSLKVSLFYSEMHVDTYDKIMKLNAHCQLV